MPAFRTVRRGPSSGIGSLDFGLKLRLIMRTLSLDTQKQLGVLLQEINPQTAYTPTRAYKWITGKAVPRSQSVFDDIAQLLTQRSDGATVGGEWLRTVDYTEFYGEMAGRFGSRVSHDLAPQPQASSQAGTSPSPYRLDGTGRPVPGYVYGAYLTISPAWSAHRRGQFVLGEMIVSRGPQGEAVLEYGEYLGLSEITSTGTLIRHGRCLQAATLDSDGEEVLTFVFVVPSPPGILLPGIMSGIAVHDAEARVLGGRILGLDLHALRGGDGSPEKATDALRGGLKDINAYCDASSAGVRSVLETMGATGGDLDALSAAICGYLDAAASDGVIDVRQAAVNDLNGYLLG